MSAPTKSRPRRAVSSRVEWFSGLGHPARHAIRHWQAGPNGQIPALCGATSPMWSAVQIVGHGRVCHVCTARTADFEETVS